MASGDSGKHSTASAIKKFNWSDRNVFLGFALRGDNFKYVDLEAEARRLQHIGLNAYESRAYLVLVGHQRFKAREVAGPARIPRQKIYEVLSSLVEKGFVRVVQGKAKQFFAVDPQLALGSFLSRQKEAHEREWQDRQELATLLSGHLEEVYTDSNRGYGPLDYIRIVADTDQIADEYRRFLLATTQEYLELARPPYAVQPMQEPFVDQLLENGATCRLLYDSQSLSSEQRVQLAEFQQTRVKAKIRLLNELPIKLALFDNQRGMISLDDPVAGHPRITALVFDHKQLATAMVSLFDDWWRRGAPL